MAERPLIVFDVNETLLDLETMTSTFQRIFQTSWASEPNRTGLASQLIASYA